MIKNILTIRPTRFPIFYPLLTNVPEGCSFV